MRGRTKAGKCKAARSVLARQRSTSVNVVRHTTGLLESADLANDAGLEKTEFLVKRILKAPADKGATCGLCYGGSQVFTHQREYTRILKALTATGYITCDDWNSHYKSTAKTTPPEKRTFRPSFGMLVDEWKGKRVGRWTAAKHRKYLKPPPLGGSALTLNPDSGVNVPANLVTLFENGATGLCLDVQATIDAIEGLPDPAARVAKLKATMQSVGYAYDRDRIPLHAAAYKQCEGGRIHAKQPALFQLPRVAREAALVSSDGGEVWEVDFKSAEVRVVMDMCGMQKNMKRPDVFDISEVEDIARQIVKDAVNPYLHGRQDRRRTGLEEEALMAFLYLASETEGERMRPVGPMVHGIYPNGYRSEHWAWEAFEDQVQTMDKRFELQQGLARLYWPSLSASVEALNHRALGMPLHDGWLFGGQERDAVQVQDIFHQVSARHTQTGEPILAKAKQVGLRCA